MYRSKVLVVATVASMMFGASTIMFGMSAHAAKAPVKVETNTYIPPPPQNGVDYDYAKTVLHGVDYDLLTLDGKKAYYDMINRDPTCFNPNWLVACSISISTKALNDIGAENAKKLHKKGSK